MTPGVHQFVHELLPHDAIGSHTILLRDALRAAGWPSEIFVEDACDATPAQATHYRRYEATPGDVLVYQLSYSPGLTDFLVSRPEPLVLSYHNVTPPDLWTGWDDGIAAGLGAASEQLRRLAPRSVLGLAVSRYNERALHAAGCRRTAVTGVLADFSRLDHPAATVPAAQAGGGTRWLFVGRLTPSKGVEDLVKGLWAYRRLYDPAAELELVGASSSSLYVEALASFVEELALEGDVRFAGERSDSDLAADYARAHVYVSTSRHEGFGVPLVEAMRAGLPVVALAAGAVPETVGDAGLLLPRAEPSLVAAAVHRIATDPVLRGRLVDVGRSRAAGHDLALASRRTVDAIATVAGLPACA